MPSFPEESNLNTSTNSCGGRVVANSGCGVFVASHRRSGTHLTLDSLVANFDHFGSGFANFDDDSSKSDQRLFKTHVDNLEASQMTDKSSKVVYVVRDGRDVLVSLYNYEKSLNQEVRDMNFAEFMRSPNPYNVTKPPMKLNRVEYWNCLLYTSPSPRDATLSRMPSSA